MLDVTNRWDETDRSWRWKGEDGGKKIDLNGHYEERLEIHAAGVNHQGVVQASKVLVAKQLSKALLCKLVIHDILLISD